MPSYWAQICIPPAGSSLRRRSSVCNLNVKDIASSYVECGRRQATFGRSVRQYDRVPTYPPGRRCRNPREIACAVAWLAGPEAATMTGQTVSLNVSVSIVGT